ncbi:MAG: PfkB family carbohydrate kinase [Bauldia sp.]
MPKSAVIVVNSLVARGAIGGRASVFALERLGFPVWSVPTVVLPWHPGHGRASRIAPDNAGFGALLADLGKAKWLGEVGALLAGYFGTIDQVAAAAELMRTLKAGNAAALFLCDPNIGDYYGLFQPEAMVVALRDLAMPLADIATPNRYELGWLTGMPIGDNAALIAAARKLGPREVLVTSAHAADGEIGTLLVTAEGTHLAVHRSIADEPHGTGDLFAALYLAHRLDGVRPEAALERATSAVLRLVALAADTGADEMPLAAGQEAFLAAPAGVTVTRL